MKKKILYIDMDGVITDFEAVFKNRFSYIFNLKDEDKRKAIDKVCNSNNIILNLEPIKDAIPTIKILWKYFEIYFLSAPLWHVPSSFSDKRVWIENKFGELATKRLILTHRKDLCIGDFLIDDRDKNGASEFQGELIKFGSDKFPNWESVRRYLMEKI